MFDANRVLGQLLGGPATAGFAGGVAGGMLTSKSGRKMAKQALKYGGVAAVGALAYTAWQKHQQNQNTVAALMAIEVDTTGEQLWLCELARQLQLPEEVVGSIHEQLGK